MKKLDSGHYFEAMDRLSVLQDSLDTYIMSHPVAQCSPHLEEALEKAAQALHEAYSIASIMYFDQKEKV